MNTSVNTCCSGIRILFLRTIFVFALLLFPFVPSNSWEAKDFSFSHLDMSAGMNSLRIFSIASTDDGALWWSSKKGVSRYNGATIFNYPLQSDGRWEHQGGRTIYLKTTGMRVWAFDNRGFIYTYNPLTDNFDLVVSLLEKFGHEVSLNDIAIEPDGFRLALHNGIYQLRDTVLTSIHQGIWVDKILQADARYYYLTQDGVLGSNFKRLLPFHAVSWYYDKQQNRIWLGSYNSGLGIARVTQDGGLAIEDFIDIEHDSQQQYPIRSIVPYDAQTMLVGVDGLGVFSVLKKPAHVAKKLFDANDGPQGKIHGNGIYSVFVDNWRNIVMGSYTGGIDIARPHGGVTTIYQHTESDVNSLRNGNVTAVMQLTPESLLFGTDCGVSIVNTRTNQWTHLLSGVVVQHIYRQPDGKVLVSTYGKGVYTIDRSLKVAHPYSIEMRNLKDNHVYATCYDSNGHLWVGCLDGDLAEITSGGVRYYPVNNVQTLAEISTGQIAVGTAFGLKLITPANRRVQDINYAPKGVADVNPFIMHIYSDGQHLWIATDGGGVYIYNLKNKQSRQLTTANGLPSNHVSSITNDGKGRIWIATEEGLCFLYASKPSKVYNVNYCPGVNRIYVRGAVTRLQNGDLLYGTSTGAVVIHPDSLRPLNYTARLNIRRVKIDNDGKDGSFPIEGRELHLDYNQRTFILSYESINMRYQFDIAHRYRLGEGEWSSPTRAQEVRFNNLQPGKHLLQLQAVSITSGEVIDETTLTIIVGQPWWNSWWMWIIYITLLACGFYASWRIYQLQSNYMRLSLEHMKQQEDILIQDTKETLSSATLNAASPIVAEDSGKLFIEKATRLVVENISNTAFDINSLCREMAMSRTLFYLKLKSYTGKSPQEFIRIIRLEHSAALLRSGHSVADSALLSGFDNTKHYSTLFKKYFGISPSKY